MAKYTFHQIDRSKSEIAARVQPDRKHTISTQSEQIDNKFVYRAFAAQEYEHIRTRDGQGIRSARYSAGILFFTNEKIEQQQAFYLSLSLTPERIKVAQIFCISRQLPTRSPQKL